MQFLTFDITEGYMDISDISCVKMFWGKNAFIMCYENKYELN